MIVDDPGNVVVVAVVAAVAVVVLMEEAVDLHLLDEAEEEQVQGPVESP